LFNITVLPIEKQSKDPIVFISYGLSTKKITASKYAYHPTTVKWITITEKQYGRRGWLRSEFLGPRNYV
jgi:hypothetical protein